MIQVSMHPMVHKRHGLRIEGVNPPELVLNWACPEKVIEQATGIAYDAAFVEIFHEGLRYCVPVKLKQPPKQPPYGGS